MHQTVDEIYLMRDRGTFTKVMLKTFLKHAITRETWIGAPWKANEAFARKYRLETNVPGHQPHQTKHQNGTSATSTGTIAKENNGPMAVVSDPSNLSKTLVEDLDLPLSSSIRPSLILDCAISGPLVYLFLETWAFFNVFLEVLMLDSFTLDDFEEALSSGEPCELVDELFCSVLKAYVESESAASQRLIDQEDQSEDQLVSKTSPPMVDGFTPVLGDWLARLKAKDFEADQFVGILIGLACHLSKDPRNAFCLVILKHMSTGAAVEKDNLAAKFRLLPADLKLQLLGSLVEWIWPSVLVRQYIDECMENLTQLRKQRAIANQEKKTKTDAIYRLRVRMRAQFPRLSINALEISKGKKQRRSGSEDQETNSKLGSSDNEMEDDEDEDLHRTTNQKKTILSGNRRASHRLTNQALEEEVDDIKDSSPSTPLLDDTEGTFKSRGDYELEITKIKRSVQRTEDKINRIDEEFRESDAQRLRKLGQDRFYNEYYFLESCGMPVFGLPNCSTSHANYATGKIFVQGPSEYALAELSQRDDGVVDTAQRRMDEEGETSLKTGAWGYYDDADQVNALLDWLNPKGKRESKLRTAIELRGEIVAQSMEHRAAYLSGEQSVPERRATRNYDPEMAERPRFQVWKNTIARKKFGHPHSGDKTTNTKPPTDKKRKR